MPQARRAGLTYLLPPALRSGNETAGPLAGSTLDVRARGGPRLTASKTVDGVATGGDNVHGPKNEDRALSPHETITRSPSVASLIGSSLGGAEGLTSSPRMDGVDACHPPSLTELLTRAVEDIQVGDTSVSKPAADEALVRNGQQAVTPEVSDDEQPPRGIRWEPLCRQGAKFVILIPSGEGKTYLAQQYPEIFTDHDALEDYDTEIRPYIDQARTTGDWSYVDSVHRRSSAKCNTPVLLTWGTSTYDVHRFVSLGA